MSRLAPLLAAALAALSLAACGSGGHPRGRVASQATPVATAPAQPRCAASGEDVPRTGVQLREGNRTLGVVLLRRSRTCASAWGVVLGLPDDARLQLATARRPGGPERTLAANGPYTRAGVPGRELADRHGCVLARATVVRGGRTVARAATPCG